MRVVTQTGLRGRVVIVIMAIPLFVWVCFGTVALVLVIAGFGRIGGNGGEIGSVTGGTRANEALVSRQLCDIAKAKLESAKHGNDPVQRFSDAHYGLAALDTAKIVASPGWSVPTAIREELQAVADNTSQALRVPKA